MKKQTPKSTDAPHLQYKLKMAYRALIVLLVILVGAWGVQAAYGYYTKARGHQIVPDFGSQNILTTGSVGIGVASPGSTLQVNGNAAIGYSASTAGPVNGLAISGNVGIGTTGPGGKLHVEGGSLVV
ncbi:hypothetical protein MYX07_06805, partial [Patescibacteria group bacterium AH-259-L07]|nr:hypothetical protein [Patescibacteria group bacterium AH-259-L07]